jgi:uncharacterized membrane protein
MMERDSMVYVPDSPIPTGVYMEFKLNETIYSLKSDTDTNNELKINNSPVVLSDTAM